MTTVTTVTTVDTIHTRLVEVSELVAQLQREISDIRTKKAKCGWCRDSHETEKCVHHAFMTQLRAQKTQVKGVFKVRGETGCLSWTFLFPKKKYPILGGYSTFAADEVKNLDFYAGFMYMKSGLPESEYLTKHESRVISDNDPKLTEWVTRKGLTPEANS